MLGCSPRAEENFLPWFCASSELVFVFPIKRHFYTNRLQQQGIGTLTQSLPRTEDGSGVTCPLLQKMLFIKGKETPLASPCVPTRAASEQLWDPRHLSHFSPAREVNFTAAQATAFN